MADSGILISPAGRQRYQEWTAEEDAALRQAWAETPNVRRVAARLGLTPGQVAGRSMRLNLHYDLPDGEPLRLKPSHAAMVGMRTIFPSRVRDVREGVPLLKPGRDSRKLGSVIEKGPWKGMPIYSLTLEERATCPKTCHLLGSCYGNSLQFSARYRHGRALESRIEVEVAELDRRHPAGFLVRLHVLGDFYGVRYVRLWDRLLRRHAGLRVFGYTARDRDSSIGRAIRAIPWYRFAIRFSSEIAGPRSAIAVGKEAVATAASRPGIVICPVETGKTRSCATCGVCWSPAAVDKTIAFIMHGNTSPRRPRISDAEAA